MIVDKHEGARGVAYDGGQHVPRGQRATVDTTASHASGRPERHATVEAEHPNLLVAQAREARARPTRDGLGAPGPVCGGWLGGLDDYAASELDGCCYGRGLSDSEARPLGDREGAQSGQRDDSATAVQSPSGRSAPARPRGAPEKETQELHVPQRAETFLARLPEGGAGRVGGAELGVSGVFRKS